MMRSGKGTDIDYGGWLRTGLILVLLLIGLSIRSYYFRKFWYLPSPEKLIAAGAAVLFITLLIKRRITFRCVFSGPVISLLLFCVFGLAGFFIHHYQSWENTLQALMMDMYFWIALWLFTVLFGRYDLKRYAKVIYFPTAVLSVFLSAETLADVLLRRWPRIEKRGSMQCVQLFYSHPAYLMEACVLLIAFLMLVWQYVKCAWLFTLLLMYPLFMTLRIRGFAVMAAAVLLIWYAGYRRKRIGPGEGAAGAVLFAAIGARRVWSFYFKKRKIATARAVLHKAGWELAVENLPFGTGFGTFGSRISQIVYSPVYYLKGLNGYPGLEPFRPAYVCDTFWPMILGETGFPGLVFYLYPVIWLIKMIQTKLRSPWMYCTACFILLFELLDTSAAQAFSGITAVYFALPLGIALAEAFCGSEEEKKQETDAQTGEAA